MSATKEDLMKVLKGILENKDEEITVKVWQYDSDWFRVELEDAGWEFHESDRSAMGFSKGERRLELRWD